MRNLITIVSLVAALYLGWQYSDLTSAKTAAEAKVAEVSAENEALKARIAKLTGTAHGQAGAAGNWLQQRILNWKDPLTSGSLGANSSGGSGKSRQRSATPTPTPLVPQTMYYTDSQGRYYFDANGGKHYVQ